MTEAAHARSKDRARPFPWAALDKVSREEAVAVRALHRWSRSLVSAGDMASALSVLLGAKVEVIVRRVRCPEDAAGEADDGVAVILGASESRDLSRATLVEVEPALGAALVARALRRSGPRVLAADGARDALAGSLAAIVIAAARRVHARRALRVVATGPGRAMARDLASASGALIEVSLTVLFNDDAFAARVLVPRAVALAAPEDDWTRASLAALGELSLALPLVAAVSESTAADVGTLRRGDAWVPGGWALRRSPSGTLEGPVLLASAWHEVGVRAGLGEEGRLVLREGVEPIAWTPAASEGEAAPGRRSRREEGGVSEADRDALVEAVGEVPVVVRVEIGIAEMRARDWASLAPGDVLSLGKKVGESVTLRVGGLTVARGELVDLDGEVAVRILGRLEGEPGQGQGRAPGKER